MRHKLFRYLFVFALLLAQTNILIQVTETRTGQTESAGEVRDPVLAGPSGEQSKTELTVGGEVEKPLKLSAAELAKLPRTTVRARDHSGADSTFEGVALVEFLKLAGVPLGEKLRGKVVSNYVIVGAADGYRAVFAIPELDPAFTDHVILLADKRDGKPLADSEGPLRVIVPQEKRQVRWVRQVIGLTICQPGCR